MQVKESFRAMGARVRITEISDHDHGSRPGLWREDSPVLIDIRDGGGGEFFKLSHRRGVELEVLDVDRQDRHLLLAAHFAAGGRTGTAGSASFLCGRDERHWFVAAIPESAGAFDVQSAKDALKPAEVWTSLRKHNVPADQRDQRRNAAFIRQGEWFFIPRPQLKVARVLIVHNEPIRRGAGKPHMCQFLFRIGGEQVLVCEAYPDGLVRQAYWQLPATERDRHRWREMVRDAHVYVKGNIRHPDHKTVWLSGWHEVVANTESKAEAMRHVAFLD
jgi:hypothetical protein